jgi:ADP-heptose:LPS heptosyltransferase
MWPIKLLYVLKNSKFFIGYQSGLNVLADNLNVPQLMLYLPFLEKMLYSWPKKQNIESGIYNAAIFKQNINEIIKNIKM